MGWLEDLQKTIGNRVREARKEKNLTQARLAELANLPTETVNRIERAVESNPTLRVLGSIARALGLEPYELFSSDARYEEALRSSAVDQLRESLSGLNRKDLHAIKGVAERLRERDRQKRRGKRVN